MHARAISGLSRAVRAFARDEEAAGLVEYALILAVIAIGTLAALSFMAGGIRDAFEMVSDHVESTMSNESPIEVAKRHGRGWCKRFGC